MREKDRGVWSVAEDESKQHLSNNSSFNSHHIVPSKAVSFPTVFMTMPDIENKL